MAFTTSQAGIDLIKSFEDCRLTAYQDSVGVWTIGYGHTNGVYAGMTITPVSYTHLDVYKRQELNRIAIRVGNVSGVDKSKQ